MVVRLLIWDLFDSKTTLAELRQHLPPLEPPSVWVSNEASERFGLIVFSELTGAALPDAVERVRELTGKDPDVGEEFDVE